MAQDLIDAIRMDHQEIKSLMEQVDRATGDREETFRRLVAKLATHETAEEEVVHPLARKTPDGDALVDARLEEESKGKEELARLEKMGVQDPAFTAEFEKLRRAVLAHAEHEETQEHPRIRDALDGDRLQKAADLFRKAESVGPTHAHAHSPESATGNVLVGTFVAVADRVRDALRSGS
jgi:hemerythrin superfamily protein